MTDTRDIHCDDCCHAPGEHPIDPRVVQAEAYVQTRFFPPLPYEYGALAIEAVDACNDGDPYYEISLPHYIPVKPKAADEMGNITAAALVSALRLEHLVDYDEDEWEHPSLLDLEMAEEGVDPRDAEVDEYRSQETGEIDPSLPGVKWFINEEGNVYPYPEHLQHEHYPNDFDLVYETEDEAAAAASAL